MRNAQGQVLQHNLLALRATPRHGRQGHLPGAPLHSAVKLYLLNGQEALLGYYMLTRREEEYGSQTLEMYDASVPSPSSSPSSGRPVNGTPRSSSNHSCGSTPSGKPSRRT